MYQAKQTKFKKTIQSRIKSFFVESINCLAPYMVRNAEFGTMHFAWSWKGAMEWLACYDASQFGKTEVFDFNGELIAHKGN